MSGRRFLASVCLRVLVAVSILSITPRALAEEPERPTEPAKLPQRQANFAWDGTLLRASFSFRDLVDPQVAQKLSRGPSNVIAMRAYVVRDGEKTPIALAVRTCLVAYDIWDEVNVEGVLRQCAEARDYPIVDRALLTPGRAHFLAVIVEVNPISAETLEQMKRWVSRPTGSTGIGAGDALFGSFVGLFLRELGTSDRTLKFRTQTFTP